MPTQDETTEEFWDDISEDPQGKSNVGEESDDENAEGETVKVGDKDIPVNELADLVLKAEEYKGLQEKYPSIKFDGLAKDYTEKSSRLAEFERTKAELDKEKENKKVDESELRAKEQVMKILSPEIKSIIEESIKDYSTKNNYEKTMSELEKEFDGKEDKIKFDREKVEKFMKDKGIANPRIAFEYEHKEELKDYKSVEERNIPFSEKTSGSGMNIPKPKKLETFEDAEKATEEMLKGSE